MKGFPLLHQEKVKQESKEVKNRRQKNAANNNIDEEPLVVNMEAWKELQVACLRTEPKSGLLFEDTIPVTPRKSKLLLAWSNIYLPKPKGRKVFLRDETKEKLDLFLSRNDVSFTIPSRSHQFCFYFNWESLHARLNSH